MVTVFKTLNSENNYGDGYRSKPGYSLNYRIMNSNGSCFAETWSANYEVVIPCNSDQDGESQQDDKKSVSEFNHLGHNL